MHPKHLQKGFTLIEVLLALAVIAIAISALLKATSQAIANTERLKEKTISHWVALQGAYQVQLGLLGFERGLEKTSVTDMFHQHWYWRAKIASTGLKSLQKISITVSKNQAGPFLDPLIAFRHEYHD